MRVAQMPIQRIFSDDDGAAVDANAATGADAYEYGINAFGMVHQLDNLVHQYANRGGAHAVTDA